MFKNLSKKSFYGAMAFTLTTQIYATGLQNKDVIDLASNQSSENQGGVSIYNLMTVQVVASVPSKVGSELQAHSGYSDGTLGDEGNFKIIYVYNKENKSYVVFSKKESNECIGIGDGEYEDRVYLNPCALVLKQFWAFIYTPTGALQLKNAYSNKCMQVSLLGNDSSSLRMRDCEINKIKMSQQWIVGANREDVHLQ